jgi:hypothetical protein
MMGLTMRLLAFPLCVIGLLAALLCNGADTSGVQTVYLMPMANGLDQHLASRLVRTGVFQVTTDLRRADAVFTESLGEGFEQRLSAALSSAEDKAVKEAKAEERLVPRISSLSRAKGTIFLVDVATKAVIWSAYQPPKNASEKEMSRAAARIVELLQQPVKR